MAAPGRKPKDPNLRLLHCTGHRPIPELPDLAGLELEPPEWLNDEARKIWIRNVKDLELNGMVADLDRVRLALYFSMEARAIGLEREISGNEAKMQSISVTDKVKELRMINGLLVTMANNLALTPTERARGNKKKGKTEDEKKAEKYGY